MTRAGDKVNHARDSGESFKRRRRLFLAGMHWKVGLILPVLLFSYAVALAAEATLNVEVPGQSWRSVRLKDLPEGAGLALQVEASSPIRVILVDTAELLRFPNTRALFDAAADRRIGFSVVIPRRGDYFVVFDNRRALEATQIRLKVQAEPPRNRNLPDI